MQANMPYTMATEGGRQQVSRGEMSVWRVCDLAINALLCGAALGSAVVGIVAPSYLFLALMLMLPLGGYQLFSALMGFLLGGSRSKGLYFLAAVIYMVGMSQVIKQFEWVWGVFIAISALAAGFYLWLSWQEYEGLRQAAEE